MELLQSYRSFGGHWNKSGPPLPHWSAAHRLKTIAIDYKIHAISKTHTLSKETPVTNDILTEYSFISYVRNTSCKRKE